MWSKYLDGAASGNVNIINHKTKISKALLWWGSGNREHLSWCSSLSCDIKAKLLQLVIAMYLILWDNKLHDHHYCPEKKTLLFQQMMGVFATGRKAQNYYHYLSMTNSCYFDLLTTNTQVLILIIKSKPTSLHHFLSTLDMDRNYIWYLKIYISEKADATENFDLLFFECCPLVLRP